MADHKSQQQADNSASATLPERTVEGEETSYQARNDELLASLLKQPTPSSSSSSGVDRSAAATASATADKRDAPRGAGLVRKGSMDASAEMGGWRPAIYTRRQSWDAQERRHEEQMAGIEDNVRVGPGFTEQ